MLSLTSELVSISECLLQKQGEDNFVLELNRVKDKVRTRFKELKECLTERETKLMNELNDILSCYNCYTTEVEKMNEQKRDLENIRNANMTVVATSTAVKNLHEKMLKELKKQLERLEIPVKPKLVTFECDKKKLLDEVNELCKLVEIVGKIDYKSKTLSIISVCDRGSGAEQLNKPRGVTVDPNTGNIYIADWANHCVKVFDNTVKFVFMFGNKAGEGKMSYPRGIVICQNTVLVSQFSNCILVYQLDGKYISRIGSRGTGELRFINPFGLSTDEYNHDIYICDSNNHRIQIISENFQYKSRFGKDILRSSRDVKLYKDNIFILDESNPCIHIFNKDLMLQKSVITRGEGQQVIRPWFFCIDKFGYVLISDRDSNSILVFNSKFEFIHKISVSNSPMGITMYQEDKVIVVCQATNNYLQIF